MKFSTVAAPALLAVAAQAADGTIRKSFMPTYDLLKGSLPGLLNGEGTPMPTPFKQLNYEGDAFTVVALGRELLSTLRPKSSPNVLAIKAQPAGTAAGTITKIDDVDTAYFDNLAFACVEELLGDTVPVSCTVRFSSIDSGGTFTVSDHKFDGGSEMNTVDIGLRSRMNIKVLESTAAGSISILLDNLVYTTKKFADDDE